MKKTYQSPYAKVIEIHFNQGILAGSEAHNEKGYIDDEFVRRRMWMEDEEDEW